MPKSGKEIRRRIRSVKNTEQITKAMKMVAAARLRKSESRTEASRPYTDTLREVMGHLGSVAADVDHPFLAHIAPEVPRSILVLLTSDKGLCGSFNSHLIAAAERHIAAERDKGRAVGLVCAGKQGRNWATKTGQDILAYYPSFNDKTTFADLKPLMDLLTGEYLSQRSAEVHLLYARFVNVVKNIPTIIRLLPIESLASDEEAAGEYRHEYMLEPSPQELLASLLPSYFRALLFQAAIENFTSENGSRMVAMDNATKAAGEMIDDLTLQYNKARQAGITLELLDIVGGAEALEG
jgi:F-type H+-transporting ATPase subunit gamma